MIKLVGVISFRSDNGTSILVPNGVREGTISKQNDVVAARLLVRHFLGGGVRTKQ